MHSKNTIKFTEAKINMVIPYFNICIYYVFVQCSNKYECISSTTYYLLLIHEMIFLIFFFQLVEMQRSLLALQYAISQPNFYLLDYNSILIEKLFSVLPFPHPFPSLW